MNLVPIVLAIWMLTGEAPATTSAPTSAPAVERYTWRRDHDPNGIGKFYMGREIAHVMSHEGADWLERSEREAEEAPSRLIESLDLRETDVVADIGAGSGYFTVRIAPRVPRGRVKAVDIQPEMLELLARRLERERIENVDLIEGREDDPRLEPASVDLALLVDVYHEFEYPYEMMTRIRDALRPGGRVVLVEYRLEDPAVPIKRVHKMSERQAIREMEAVGLRHVRTVGVLPRQHILVFAKEPPASSRAGE